MRFAHLADCHLGGWRHPELQRLNFESFKYALEKSKKEKVDFMLIAGDLFDSAYPPIETIKDTFDEFRKLKEAGIPVFLIAGSHDYSVSGKSFLDVLEKAGFITNVAKFEEKDNSIILQPTIHKNVAIYGYPGKKTGLDIYDVARIKLNEAPGLFKILMLHTTMQDAIGTLPIPAVDQAMLPKVNYVALGHLHLAYEKDNRVYGGPIYPNNASELEDLKCGCFYIVDTLGSIKRNDIKIKDVTVLDIEIKDSLIGTDTIIDELKKQNLKDKILILKVKGTLERGKPSDLDFVKIENYARGSGAYSFLKNTTRLFFPITEIDLIPQTENFEEEILSKFKEQNPHKFNFMIDELIPVLGMEKKEDESSRVFEERLLSESRRVILK